MKLPSLAQIRELCTKVLWLEKGQQIAFGDTSILCSLYQQYLDKTITLEQAREKWNSLNQHYDYLVVGSGLFGSTFAREAADRGKHCLVIDGREHLGGNVYCENRNGITVHEYGPHIFHTNDEFIWSYVNCFVKFFYDGDFQETHQGIPTGGYNRLIQGLLEGIPTVTGVTYQRLMEAYPDIADKVVYTGSIDGFFEYSLGHL